MKEKYRAFKEWKKNPRHRALFELLCWFIFFGILYLIAVSGVFSPKYRTSNRDNESGKMTNDSIENYINMSSFEYQYIINYDDNTITIEGIVYDGKNYFTIDDNKYYEDEILYLVDEENKLLIANPEIELPILLSEIDRNAIYLWLNDGSTYEKISYNDGSTSKIIKYSPTEEYVIEISTKEKEHLINSLEIDLTELLQAKNIVYNTFLVNITYTNINNISSYEKNYDDYKIVEAENDEEIVEEANEELVEEEV